MQLSTFPFSISQVTVLYLQQLHRGFWLSSLPGSEASTKKQKKKKKKKKKREIQYSSNQAMASSSLLLAIKRRRLTPQFLKPTTHGKILKYPIKKDHKKVF